MLTNEEFRSKLDHKNYMAREKKVKAICELNYSKPRMEKQLLLDAIEKEANVVELKGLFKKRLEEFAVGSHAREVKKELDSVGFGEPILEFNPIASSSYIPNFQKAIDTFI